MNAVQRMQENIFRRNRNLNPADLKALLAQILVNASDEKEQWWAFRQWFEEKLQFPLHGFVLGEPVLVSQIDYDGNPRRGLTAICRKLNDEKYVAALADVELLKNSEEAGYLAAYRMWLGIESVPYARAIRSALRHGKPAEAGQ